MFFFVYFLFTHAGSPFMHISINIGFFLLIPNMIVKGGYLNFVLREGAKIY